MTALDRFGDVSWRGFSCETRFLPNCRKREKRKKRKDNHDSLKPMDAGHAKFLPLLFASRFALCFSSRFKFRFHGQPPSACNTVDAGLLIV